MYYGKINKYNLLIENEKQLTGGIRLVDEIPLLKINKLPNNGIRDLYHVSNPEMGIVTLSKEDAESICNKYNEIFRYWNNCHKPPISGSASDHDFEESSLENVLKEVYKEIENKYGENMGLSHELLIKLMVDKIMERYHEI